MRCISQHFFFFAAQLFPGRKKKEMHIVRFRYICLSHVVHTSIFTLTRTQYYIVVLSRRRERYTLFLLSSIDSLATYSLYYTVYYTCNFNCCSFSQTIFFPLSNSRILNEQFRSSSLCSPLHRGQGKVGRVAGKFPKTIICQRRT